MVISEKKESDALVEEEGQEQALDQTLVIVDVAQEPDVVDLAGNLVHVQKAHDVVV